MTDHSQHGSRAAEGHNEHHYRRLLVMTVMSFAAMYVLMYAMVDRLANVYPNFNQFYMAALMAAAMIVIELVVMGGMYPNKRLKRCRMRRSCDSAKASFAVSRRRSIK